jgi:hypothetical protein
VESSASILTLARIAQSRSSICDNLGKSLRDNTGVAIGCVCNLVTAYILFDTRITSTSKLPDGRAPGSAMTAQNAVLIAADAFEVTIGGGTPVGIPGVNGTEERCFWSDTGFYISFDDIGLLTKRDTLDERPAQVLPRDEAFRDQPDYLPMAKKQKKRQTDRPFQPLRDSDRGSRAFTLGGQRFLVKRFFTMAQWSAGFIAKMKEAPDNQDAGTAELNILAAVMGAANTPVTDSVLKNEIVPNLAAFVNWDTTLRQRLDGSAPAVPSTDDWLTLLPVLSDTIFDAFSRDNTIDRVTLFLAPAGDLVLGEAAIKIDMWWQLSQAFIETLG